MDDRSDRGGEREHPRWLPPRAQPRARDDLLAKLAAGSCRRSGCESANCGFLRLSAGPGPWSGRLADPGENDGPFATVARARDAVRALLKTRKEPQPVRVVLRGGTYYLDAAAGIRPGGFGNGARAGRLRAAAGEKVVLSGGRRIENGRWGEVNGEGLGGGHPASEVGDVEFPAALRERRTPAPNAAAAAG